MDQFLGSIEFWHWWILALILAGIEALVPGLFFIWFGLAALITGVFALVLPALHWEWQAVVFVVLAVVAVFVGRRFLRRKPSQTEDPALNRRGERYIGRQFTLETAIVNGRGSVKVDDGVWRAAGPELSAGRKVKVVGLDGATMKVEPAD